VINLLFIILFSGSFGQADKSEPFEVYIFLHDECIISRYYTRPLRELHETYGDIAEFIGVFPNPSVNQARLVEFKTKYQVPFRLITDADFRLLDKFGATVTPEVFVMEVGTGNVLYAGRIDNAYARVGKKRTVVTQHELKSVLSRLRSGQASTIEHQPAIGCIITKSKIE
jgi:hypothetical protein